MKNKQQNEYEVVDLPLYIQSKLRVGDDNNEKDDGQELQNTYDKFTEYEESSSDSLNILIERQRERQLNHFLHQHHIKAQGIVSTTRKVKETNKISLEYDPISKRKVLNTYEIIRELGHGQHGKVKLALDLVTKQQVAIKIVDRHDKKRNIWKLKSGKCDENNKIRREIAIMKKCNHEHVVKLIEILDDRKSRKIYLVLEYCSKGEIKWCSGDQLEIAARGPPLLSFQRTREILRGGLLGLEYLHYQGIIHRDIKPANLLLSENDVVKISDFGVSLASPGISSSISSSSSSSSITGSIRIDGPDELELAKTAGTPAFFAPEICLGNDAYDMFKIDRSQFSNKGSLIFYMIDIWALGVTLYCLLFGKVPFTAECEMELFEKIVNDKLSFPSLNEINSNNVSNISCAEEYEVAQDLLNKILEKNPLKRIPIAEIKQHPFVCWDFDHPTSTDENYLNSKATEKMKFVRNNVEGYQQISVSLDEVDNAVYGVGAGLKKSQGSDLLHFSSTRNYSLSKDSDITFSPDDSKSKVDLVDGLISSTPASTTRYNFSPGTDIDNFNFILSEEPFSGYKDASTTVSLCESPEDRSITQPELSAREIFQRELQKLDHERDPNSIVSLPVNSSFASLDSLYIDNYALNGSLFYEADHQSSHSFEVPGKMPLQTSNFINTSNKTLNIYQSPSEGPAININPSQYDKRIVTPPTLSVNTSNFSFGRFDRMPRTNILKSSKYAGSKFRRGGASNQHIARYSNPQDSSSGHLNFSNKFDEEGKTTSKTNLSQSDSGKKPLALGSNNQIYASNSTSRFTNPIATKQFERNISMKDISYNSHASDEDKARYFTALESFSAASNSYKWDDTISDVKPLHFELGMDLDNSGNNLPRNISELNGITSLCERTSLHLDDSRSDIKNGELAFDVGIPAHSRRIGYTGSSQATRDHNLLDKMFKAKKSQPPFQKFKESLAPHSISTLDSSSHKYNGSSRPLDNIDITSPHESGPYPLHSKHFRETIDVPDNVLNMIPELQTEISNTTTPVPLVDDSNHSLLSHVSFPTTQESQINQLISSSGSGSSQYSSKEMLQGVLSTPNASRRGSALT